MIKKPIILLTIVAMISCDDKISDQPLRINSYPMTIGNEWLYDRQLIVTEFENDTSDIVIDVDTFKYSYRVWIDKDTLLNDTMDVTIIKEHESNYNRISYQYSFIDDEGLKNYAYFAGAPIATPKKHRKIESYLTLHHSILITGEIIKPFKSDQLIIEKDPPLALKLPLDENTSWTYRYPYDRWPLQIDKHVIGTEILDLIGQKFECYKIHWDYLNDTIFLGTDITDWISKEGLIKRIIKNDRQELVNQEGEPFEGYIEITEILTLKGLTIK